LWVSGVYHFGSWTHQMPAGLPRKVLSKIYGALRLGVELTTGCTIHREAKIGDDLHLVHGWNIRIHPCVVIGDRCGIMHDVTIGTNMDRGGVATIGDDVFIGAGAKILGKLTIGDRAVIGANSLVIADVPPGATAIGVPARVMRGIPRVAARDDARANTKDEGAHAGDPPVVDAEKEGGALDKAPVTS
jgi:serine O-acetyltransferase